MLKDKMTKTICALSLALTLCCSCKVNAWDGKANGTGTHAVIVTQAVEILKNDVINSSQAKVKENFQILQSYLQKLQHGSTYPDYDPTAYELYQDHFWDPDTDNNFTKDNSWYLTYAINQTGESQLRKLFALAKNEWKKGNYEQAVWLLGQGLHYFGDITTPYHPANVTALDSPGHVKFETYVEERKDNYKINTVGDEVDKNFYPSTLENTNLDQWLTEYSKVWAKKSKAEYYAHASMKHNWNDWNIGATNTMHNAQIGSAGIIYRFLNEVSGTVQTQESDETNEITLVIKTANERNSGTDHAVHFGIELKDGQKLEWTLDNPGNDFEKNQQDTYRIKLKDSLNLKDIKRYWLRTEKTGGVHDDWKPEYLKIVMNSSVKFDTNINELFVNNHIRYFDLK